MAWNKNSYYYQNQMKVLSGSDPEPGYIEDDETTSPSTTEVNKRISANGLYKFVSLIKAKFEQLRDTNWSLIDKNATKSKLPAKKDLNDLKGDLDTIGNYYHAYSTKAQGETETDLSNKDKREALHYPKYLNTNTFSSVLKVSAPGGSGAKSVYEPKDSYARQELLHNMNPNRYVRLHSGRNYNSGETEPEIDPATRWTDWYVFVPLKEEEAKELGLIDEQGHPKPWGDIFLKRKEDWTTGSIGFGKDPAMDGEDYSKGANAIKAKIVLGEYTYGPDLPSVHYGKDEFKDLQIPKGQIYLQYDNSIVEQS